MKGGERGEHGFVRPPGHNEVSGVAQGPVVQAGAVHGDVRITVAGQVGHPVPAQLAPAPAVFVDRLAELRELGGVLEQADGASETPVLIVITGLGGVGKSSLALHWLHHVRARFPDGQLYADLGGFAAEREHRAGQVLERFLRALGIAPERVPASLEEQVALFRSATAGRRLIVMLDNAVSAAQVRLFLPSSGGSLVLVTTRYRLSGLVVDGARFIELRPLRREAAVELLARLLGSERVRREAEAAGSLVDRCGRLPIAVCASAARLALRPHWSIRRLDRQLADAHHRLSVLGDDIDTPIRAVFDVSYAALSDEEARMYRMLGLHPGPTFGTGVAAAVADVDEERAAELLDALAGASLVQEEGEERYRFHDLLRLHAEAKAAETEPDQVRRAAERRIVHWFLKKAAAADLVVIPGRWHLGPIYETVRGEPRAFADPAAALDWLEAELPNLRAVLRLAEQRGMHELVWQLCETLWGLFYSRKHYVEWLDIHETGIAAARRAGDVRAEARMVTALAHAHYELHHFTEAADLYRRAAGLLTGVDHPLGEAAALEGLGSTCLALGRPDEAIDHFERSRAIHERLGRPRGVARMLRRLAEAHLQAGRVDEAIDLISRSRDAFARLGEPLEQTRILTWLGRALVAAGRAAEALEPLRRARDTAVEIGARHAGAEAAMHLADALVATGDPGAAHAELTRAQEIFVDLRSPLADQVRRRLEELGPPG